MAKFVVTWEETFCCRKEVEAESESDAIEKCYDTDNPDERHFGEYSNFTARQIEKSEEIT